MSLESVIAGDHDWHVEQGDALEVMRSLPDGCVSTLITSPPYWSLRSYLPDDHPDKVREMGSEPGPGPFLDALLDVIDEAHRVLAPWGSIIVNLGDTYAGSGGAGGDYAPGSLRASQRKFEGSAIKHRRYRAEKKGQFGGALDKSLCGVPSAFELALIYGRNFWTGRECKQWRVRNRNTWCKPNPAVGELIDRWRTGSEPVFFASKASRYYFDLQAIRKPSSQNTHARTAKGVGRRPNNGKSAADERGGGWATLEVLEDSGATAPPLDWWVVVPTHYRGTHFATFPVQLIWDPIEAACPRNLCRNCGKPRERIMEPTEEHAQYLGADLYGTRDRERRQQAGRIGRTLEDSRGHPRITSQYRTTGWTECECEGDDRWLPGIVLDPFCGSGTAGVVSRRLGRRFIGIELSEDYAEMSRKRIDRALLPEPVRSRPVDRPGQASLL